MGCPLQPTGSYPLPTAMAVAPFCRKTSLHLPTIILVSLHVCNSSKLHLCPMISATAHNFFMFYFPLPFSTLTATPCFLAPCSVFLRNLLVQQQVQELALCHMYSCYWPFYWSLSFVLLSAKLVFLHNLSHLSHNH